MNTAFFPTSAAKVEAGLPITRPLTTDHRQRSTPTSLQGPLSLEEHAELARCESEIEARLDSVTKHFREIGAVLAGIRDKRLYRAEFGTFEEYCHKRWHRSGRRIRQLCDASDVVRNLEAAEPVAGQAGLTLPQTESQARPLVGLPKDLQAKAWEMAKANALEGEVTAGHVAQAVRKVKAETGKQKDRGGEEPVAREFGWKTRQRIDAAEKVQRCLGELRLSCFGEKRLISKCDLVRRTLAWILAGLRKEQPAAEPGRHGNNGGNEPKPKRKLSMAARAMLSARRAKLSALARARWAKVKALGSGQL